jgi:predicted transcriptional regulator
MENPGITIIRIADIVGVRHQTVCYHLKKMKRHGHVVAHAKGNRLLHFLNGAVATEEERDLIPVAHDAVAMEILARIAESPGIMKKDVATSTGLTRTGGAWHVNKLTRKGIVREQRVGGHCRLYPVPERVEMVRLLSLRQSKPVFATIDGDAGPPGQDP